MLIGWLSAVAFGCAGMFGVDGNEVFSAAQQVVFEQGDGWVDVDYLVDYGGNQTDFGWVIPVPGPFVELAEGDADRFDQLGYDTSPQITYHYEEAKGCRPNDKGGSWQGTNTVTIVDQGTAGVFDYVALAATDVVALEDWLETNGWSVGPSGPSLQAYVAEGGWQFVAVTLSEEAQADSSGNGGRTSARIRYEGDQMVFPARMSRFSMAEEQTTTVYVLGDQQALLGGWEVVDLPDVRVVDQWNMTEDLREIAAVLPTYARVYADQVDGQWVTRFDTVTQSDQHESDVRLTLDGGESTFHPDIQVFENQTVLDDYLHRGCSSTGARAASVGWLWFGAILLWRRRR